ncbi:MAG: YlbF family regulator [Lachnospiraceae bacterium]|nr:YlbF family regulator [Lachnospiraceae bacterium]
MLELEEALQNLLSVLKEQECCQKYQEALQELKEDKELFAKFNEFRKKNIELHIKKNTLKEQTALRNEYEGLLLKEPVNHFLYWEQKTTELFRSVFESIADDMEFDYSFLD